MNTQIYATFGPACQDEAVLKQMIDAGMSGMRLNLSHTTLPKSASYINAYKSATKQCDVLPQILIDMQGPELRVGDLETTLLLEEGEEVVFCLKDGAEDSSEIQKVVPVPKEVKAAVESGDIVLLDDGKIQIQIIECVEKVSAKVIRGGELKGHKSIKIKDKNIPMPVLTEHDIENIKLAKEYGVTALMQPFVLSGANLKDVRDALNKYGAGDISIYAKIENRIGVENIEDIIPEADVIIIARGDLGNDMPLWELPRVQKKIENVCKKHKKPYIVVTQMLASMETNAIPTRAEVSDIFHAVMHGAYGVMITGESAIGKYPVEAVKYLANTAKEAEGYCKEE